MTQKEITRMKPGRELNQEVAEKIIGNVVTEDKTFGYMERSVDKNSGSVWDLLQPYSEDISAAELVVDRMLELGYDDAINWSGFGDGLYTEPEAICKAALLTV